MEKWKGKVAVVTGASTGIGAAISVQLASNGLIVVGAARRVHLIEELNNKVEENIDGRIYGRKCDFLNYNEIEDLFKWTEEKFGAVHVLINNAGFFKMGSLTVLAEPIVSTDDVTKMIDLNFKSVVLCTKIAVEIMSRRGICGHIVNICSLFGHDTCNVGRPIFNVYPSTKFAVKSFTEIMRQEFTATGSKIRISEISPGLTDTPMANDIEKAMGCLHADDVADAVLYVLGTPDRVNIRNIVMRPTGDTY